MMAEGINGNGHNNDPLSGNEYEILEQESISNVQIGSISRSLSDYPKATLSVHKFLQTNCFKSNQQQRIMQPVNSTPECGHLLDESGSSIHNGKGRRKYPRKYIDNNTHKQSQNVQQEINLQPQQPSSSMSSDQLKEDVENAIQKELLQRLSLQEKSSTFGLRDQDFPPLATSDNHSNKKWNIAQLRTTVASTFLRASDTEKTFESINETND
ncbi:unnamed protein product [Rotaria magnacalcarata]|uniref:Uncharacterized protein n=1 Tax=Rotaria magnacalcarata TaxID=392030 RepID=A0A816N9Z4_9BILA|nr:unnamed protein product [Rotaria magnacalcarata]